MIENMPWRLRSKWLLLCALFLLLGCGPTAAEPTPQPALAPIVPAPIVPTTAAGLPEPAPTVAAPGETLPGRLLFVQGGNLWLWQGDSSHQITSTGDAFQPAWSPDGERIAYVRRDTSYSDLIVQSVNGGEPTRLTRDGPDRSVYSYERIYASMWAFYPAWSPDGEKLAYAGQAGPPGGSPAAEYRMSLFAIPAEGGRRVQIFAEAAGHVGRPAYAPDGQTIVFDFDPVEKEQEPPGLYRYNIAKDTGVPQPGAPTQSYDPAFSPDGRWLAFAARADGRTDIFVQPAGGGTPIRLTSLGAARAPAFSPDGHLLAFLAVAAGTNSFDLWVAELQTENGTLRVGEPRQITHDMHLDADSGISWAR
jgi:TolB protein